MTRPTVGFSIIVGLLAAASAALVAGPLTPPAGPVTGSYKTLSEVEPRIAIGPGNTPGDATAVFRITQPGSYYLTGNVAGVAGKNGIRVSAAAVTLDLNGFSVIGVAGALSGVFLDNVANYVMMKNGSVSDWPLDGIDAGFNTHGRYERLFVTRNGAGAASRVGLRSGSSAIICDCDASYNTGVGFWCNEWCTISGCVATSNAFTGIVASAGAVVTGCSADQNGGSGIYVGAGSAVTDCVANGSGGGPGIYGTNQCTVRSCTVTASGGHGVLVGNGSTVTGCSSHGNSDSGYYVSDGSTISGCTATENLARGIFANNGCKVTGCLTRNNQSDGISVNYSSAVSDNNCNGDGAANGSHGGIRVVGQANRIDSNNVSYGDRGLLIEQGGNVVLRNTSKGCVVNFEIAAGNDSGPIGSAATATSPWANIQF